MFLKRFGPAYTFWMYPYERFNSWITRRVLNRRYPEATVVDFSVSVIDNQASREQLTLAEEQVEQLQTHYLAEILEYRELIEQYNDERKQAKMHHQLRRFPELSEWMPKHSLPLSKCQLEMRCVPSCSAVKLRNFIYKDTHSRTVMLSSVDSDHEHTYRRCSYVSTKKGAVIMIGRIVTIFEHSLSTTTAFAYVSWFDGPYTDTESNLVFVLTSSQTQSITPISSLSKPLVVAYDDEEPDKVWILSLVN